MKRFLLPIIFFLLASTSVEAKNYTYTENNKTDTIAITTTDTVATFTYTHTGTAGVQRDLAVWKTKNDSSSSLSDKVAGSDKHISFQPKKTGTETWTVNSLTPNTTYYLALNEPFQTEAPVINTTSDVTAASLTFKPDGGYMNVSGKIDTSKYPYPEGLFVQLEWSSQGTFSTDLNQKPEGVQTAPATTTPGGNIKGVNHDGTYYWKLPNIDQTTYWYRETFYTSDGKPVGSPVLNKFNGADGFSPTTPAEAQNDFEAKSYRLLAPLPGLSVLLDPSLCREQKIENPGKGQICDINDFLNYLFRLMIGVAAVILVIRIIIEGFKYATSDVLSIKISSKQKLFQGIWGLLLALSAWLILNTINPKLVEETITLPTVNLNIEDDGDIAAPITLGSTGQLPSGVYCPKSGKSDAVSKVAQSWIGKIVYYLDGSKKDGATILGRGKNSSALTDGKARLDCSGYVNVVLACAGYSAGTDFVNSGTTDIFKNAEQIKTINSDTSVTTDKGTVTLRPGDLLGWTSQSGGSIWGHVIIYVGNGQVMESTRVSGNVLAPVKLTSYRAKNKLVYLKQIP